MLYIKFKISDPAKYTDLENVFAQLTNIVDQRQRHPMEFWLSLFPPHAQQHYNRGKLDSGIDQSGKMRFKRMIKYFERDLEVDLDGIEKLEEDTGIIKFSTGNYPYGGMDNFILFTKTFDCIPFEIYNGFHVCAIHWNSEYDFSAKEINV